MPVLPTVALPLLADHVPPVTASVRLIVVPVVRLDGPLIVPAVNALTVTIVDVLAVPQPFVTIYEILAVPPATPLTVPSVPTVAIAPLEVLQVPPAAASVSAVVEPAHTVAVPVIAPAVGNGLTVTVAVAAAVPQPLVTVYDIVVVPPERPLTTPDVLTVPTAVFVELHTPPVIPSAKLIVDPAHTVPEAGEIIPAFAPALTVTTVVAVQPEP